MQAEDLAQEALIAAYHKLDSLEREESFAPWLRGIARHLCLSFLRKKSREIPMEPETLEGLERGFEAFDGAQTQDEWLGRVAIVHQCLDALPEKLGSVFRRHYLDERKVKEIAEEQSVAVAAVLKRLERARDAVKECVHRRLRREGER
jgi:RNA polymerase sigma factor (sigma-70 family)